jgi:flagellar hook-length control protein FliK
VGLTTLASTPGAPQTAFEAVRQLADALPNHAAGDRTVLNLEPPELGHLEIEFRQDQGRMVATVSVERPETLDLLRRHADILLRDLAESGYAEAEVAFGEGRTAQDGDGAQDRPALANAETDSETGVPVHQTGAS